MADVLVVVAPGAEEIETMAVADVLVRVGQQVTMASAGPELVVAGSRGLPLAAHCGLDDCLDRAFAVVYLPGGMGSATTCRDDARIQDLMARQLREHRTLAVICASVISLLPQGLARTSRVTSYPGVRAQVEPQVRSWLDQPVVEDGDLVTSQGPGTAISLGLVLARRLSSAAAAATVASALLVGMPA